MRRGTSSRWDADGGDQNTDKWMPKLKGCAAKDEETKLLENAQNQIEYICSVVVFVSSVLW